MKDLRYLFFCLAIPLAVFGQSVANANGPELSGRLQVTADISPGIFIRGSDVELRLHLKNISGADIRLSEASAERDYDVLITNDAGKEPERTERGRSFLSERQGSSV